MVTTRRGSQRSSQQNVEDPTAPGPSTVSQRGPSTSGRGRGRSAAQYAPDGTEVKKLQDTEDGGATNRDLDNTRKGACLAAISREATAGHVRGVTAEDPCNIAPDEENPEAMEKTAAGSATLEREVESSPGPSGGDEGLDDGESQPESTGSDSEDDDDIVGPNLMDQLASSLKAALQARGGAREASPPAPHAGLSSRKLGLTSDPMAIRWHPDVPQSNASGSDVTIRAAPGVGAEKEKGLANQLLAPPRVNAAEGPTSSASKRWFKLPATKITDEMKQELRLLRLRGAYDPKRFYKSFDETKFPTHFQIGTVVDNPQDFYSSRLTARERGANITQELLGDPALAAARKKRYGKLQQEATRYQKVKKRKTDLVRANPKPKRPKH